MSWPYDPTDPLFTPEEVVRRQQHERGLPAGDDRLPAIMVATFQRAAYEKLRRRAGAAEHDTEHDGSGTTGMQAIGTVDGVPIALARITVGAPAAAIVLEEAIARGVQTFLLIGSAGSLQPGIPLGSAVLVESAEREDGTSHHYLPAADVVRADPHLTDALEVSARRRGLAPIRGRTWTIDAPYRETVGAIRRHRSAGVAVVEMEAAAVFAVAQVRRVRAALLVAVSDELAEVWTPGFRHHAFLRALSACVDAALDAAVSLGTGHG